MHYTIPIGSISHGTLRNEDLISAFSHELEYIVRRGCEDGGDTTSEQSWCNQADNIKDWNSKEADELVSEAFDLLSEHCPPYCYFGAHPGDGADFGCWPYDIEDIQEMGVVTVSDPAELQNLTIDVNEALYVNDHGNVTLYVRRDCVWCEVWSIV